MGNYWIKCIECNNEFKINLTGKDATRKWKLENYKWICNICKDIAKDKSNQEDKERNLECGFPELTGTRKQIDWAETIRKKKSDVLDDIINKINVEPEATFISKIKIDDPENKLLSKFVNIKIQSVKISQKDIAIELGINTRSVRRIKKETPGKFNLVSDALKLRRIIGNLDIRIKREVDITEQQKINTYWVYENENKIIGFDFKMLQTLGLEEREIKNLHREDIKETTISNKSIRKQLTDKKIFL